jgi:hypothetical protein
VLPVVLQRRRRRDVCSIQLHATLRSLKQSARQHLFSDPHKRELVVAAGEKDWLQRHRNTGLTLGRLALQTIREGSSHVMFPGKVLDCHLNGGRVGDVNHSRVFMKDMFTAFHQVTVDNISRFLSGIDPVTN